MPMAHFDVEFDKNGDLFDAGQGRAIVSASAGFTDLIVIAHGWNNNIDDARSLYDGIFASVERVMGNGLIPNIAGRTFGVARVFWPSKKFESAELIPAGGAAALDASGPDAALLAGVLDRLKVDPARLGGSDTNPARTRILDDARSLVPRLDSDPAARQTYLDLIRSLLDPAQAGPDDASREFFETPADAVFDSLKEAVVAPGRPAAGGGADLGNEGGAAGFGDLLSGMVAAARRIANYATYYEMKARAGDVGRRGVIQLLNAVRAANPMVRLHLIGHSFGGRLVTAAAHALAPNTKSTSLTLLQAAFSHNGLSANFDGNHRGAFREVLSEARVSGPIVITYTKNDDAVGVAYPLASRLARQVASALGDENDPYGGMGRNGAQHTAEVDPAVNSLTAVGPSYNFRQGRVYNLMADSFIHDHSDIQGFQVAFAILSTIAAVG